MDTTTQFAKLIGVDPMTLRRWDKKWNFKTYSYRYEPSPSLYR